MTSRFEAVWCPKCRPPRRKTVKTGCCGRGGLRFGHNGACRGVLFAPKPLNMRLGGAAHAHLIGPTCGLYGPGADRRANVRVVGPTCTSKGPRAQDAFTETEEGLTTRRPPNALNMPRETTEAGPRRTPPLVTYGDHAVGAEKSRYQQHVESYNQSWRSALLRPGLVRLGLSAVLPATEEHRQRRGQRRVLHANLDHGRARRLIGAAAGNDTSGQRSGPTATQDKPRTPNGLTEHATI